MKTKATMILALCIALGILALGCSPRGSGNNAVGEWAVVSDAGEGGVSTITMTELQIDGKTAYNFKGHVPAEGTGIAWPWVQAEFHPDEATLEALQNAAGISFMTRGNGGAYTIRYQIDTVTDWAWHGYTFDAPAQATKIEIPMDYFMQPSWGAFRRLDPSGFFLLSLTPSGYAIDYDVTIWDLQIDR